MFPGRFILALAAGIVGADGAGHVVDGVSVASIGVWLVGLGACAGVLLVLMKSGDERSRNAQPLAGILRGACLLSVLGLFFVAGYDGLETALEGAQADRTLAEAGKGDGIRLAQARVRARRRGAWGDEVELEFVSAIDGARRLPSRLVLRFAHDGDGPEVAASSRADRLLWPGEWVRLGILVRPLQAARNPGTRDREHADARRGLGARARLVKPDWVVALKQSEWVGVGGFEMPFAAAGRNRWRRHVGARFDEENIEAALVRAFALGDRTGISAQSRDSFRRLGLSHLVAISGLHIGFIAGLAGWIGLKTIVWLVPGGRRIRVFDWVLALACCAAAFYAWLTDAGISVERASLLFALYAFCRLALRRIPPASALGWVALVILLAEPAALFDVAAQLSFAACSALIAAGFWRSAPESGAEIQEPVQLRLSRMLGATYRASLVVSLGTAPWAVQFGFPIAVLSPLFNVVAIPWTGLLALPSSLVAVCLIDVLPGPLLRALTLPARGLEASAISIAGMLPDWPSETRLAMPVFVALIGLAFFALRRERWLLATLLWAVCSLAGASAISFEPALGPTPRAIFFDVGQGDATLLQGRDFVLVVDTGPGPPGRPGGAALVRGLRAAGVRRIDILVLTHGDLDHRGGLGRVLESFEVGELWLPDAVSHPRDEELSRVASTARGHGIPVIWQAAELSGPTHVRPADEFEIDVLWPIRESPGVGASRNENSLVLRVVMDETAFLLTADIGIEVENQLIQRPGSLSTEFLKVAHHGSRRSSSTEFLSRVSPRLAILSAPCDSARGLPNGQAVERIRRSGARLWWTGRDGAVVVSKASGRAAMVRGWGIPRECTPR